MSSPLLLSLFDETERRPLTVAELTSQVRGALENRFASVWVEGEISNFKAHTSGHWYFTIKDESAQLRAKCFRGANSRIRFRPSDGLQVRARGRLTVYEPRGEYELVVEGLDPVGAGALRIAFEQLRDRLAHEGLFDESRKQTLPLLPRRVAIVTSPTGAAIRDIIRTITRRTRTVSLLLVPVRVQGDGAGREIAEAIKILNEHHARALREGRDDELIDALIVGRGGGSAEDLWAFNEEEVARAIAASKIPIISAVGHEIDFTIADFVADVRAATPTAAAELVAAREDEIAATIDALTRELARALEYNLIELRARVQDSAISQGFDDVRARLREAKEQNLQFASSLERLMMRVFESAKRKTDALVARLSPANLKQHTTNDRVRLAVAQNALNAAGVSKVEAKRARLSIAVAALDALSPLAVLQRGYALALRPDGGAVRDANEVETGERLRVQLARGVLICRVEEVER